MKLIARILKKRVSKTNHVSLWPKNACSALYFSL